MWLRGSGWVLAVMRLCKGSRCGLLWVPLALLLSDHVYPCIFHSTPQGCFSIFSLKTSEARKSLERVVRNMQGMLPQSTSVLHIRAAEFCFWNNFKGSMKSVSTWGLHQIWIPEWLLGGRENRDWSKSGAAGKGGNTFLLLSSWICWL